MKLALKEIYDNLSEEEKNTIAQEYKQYEIDKKQGKEIFFLMDIVDGKIKSVGNKDDFENFRGKMLSDDEELQNYNRYLDDYNKISQDLYQRNKPLSERDQTFLEIKEIILNDVVNSLTETLYVYEVKDSLDPVKNTLDKITLYMVEPLYTYKKAMFRAKYKPIIEIIDCKFEYNDKKSFTMKITYKWIAGIEKQDIHDEQFDASINNIKIKIIDFIQYYMTIGQRI